MSLRGNYVYPPGWDGDYGDGRQGWRNHILNVTGQYDSEVISPTTIVDISEMLTTSGDVPDRMAIDKIEYSISDCKIQLTWDRNPISDVAFLSGSGCLTFKGGLVDPSLAGSSGGDLMLTLLDPIGAGEALNSTFDVTVHFRLKKD